MYYNYKNSKKVQDIIIESYRELVEDIYDEYTMLHRNDVLYVYAPIYVVKVIINALLDINNDFRISDESDIDLFEDGENEVILTVDNHGVLFIEETRGKSGNLKHSGGTSSLTYVYDSFKQSEVSNLAEEECSILVFGFEDDDLDDDSDDEECETCPERFECENYTGGGKAPATSSATSTHKYTVNGKSATKEEYENAINELDSLYLDGMKDMLLRYASIQDELNEWKKRLYW
jgi:hypothetical protein